MKIKIGPYKNWIGPYHIAEALCFWAKSTVDEYGRKSKPRWVHDFGTWLSEDKNGDDRWLSKLCHWIYSKRERKVKIHIDPYDTWNMHSTLSMIILPMLKQLKGANHGSPHIKDEDVPDHLRSTNAPPKKDEWDIDENHFKRWDWVMDEMIWAFEQNQPDCDWEAQYSTGEMDTMLLPVDKEGNKIGEPYRFGDKNHDEADSYQMIDGPSHTYKTDYDALKKHQERIDNGFRLFGKYYQALWD